jgi:hypothetical protein
MVASQRGKTFLQRNLRVNWSRFISGYFNSEHIFYMFARL